MFKTVSLLSPSPASRCDVRFKGNFVFECTLNFPEGSARPAIVKLFIGGPRNKWRYQESLEREYYIYKCVVSNFDQLPFFACPYFCTDRGEIPRQFHTSMEAYVQNIQYPDCVYNSDQKKWEDKISTDDVQPQQKCFMMCTENCKGPTLDEYLFPRDQSNFLVRWAQTFLQLDAAIQRMVTNSLVHNDLHFGNIKVVTQAEFYFNCQSKEVVQNFSESECVKLKDTVKIFDWDLSYIRALPNITNPAAYQVHKHPSLFGVYDKLALIRFITVTLKRAFDDGFGPRKKAAENFFGTFKGFETTFEEVFGAKNYDLYVYNDVRQVKCVQMTDIEWLHRVHGNNISEFTEKVDNFMNYLREGAIQICKANEPQAST